MPEDGLEHDAQWRTEERQPRLELDPIADPRATGHRLEVAPMHPAPL